MTKLDPAFRSQILSYVQPLKQGQLKHLTPQERKILNLIIDKKHLSEKQHNDVFNLQMKLITIKHSEVKPHARSTWGRIKKRLGINLESRITRAYKKDVKGIKEDAFHNVSKEIRSVKKEQKKIGSKQKRYDDELNAEVKKLKKQGVKIRKQ